MLVDYQDLPACPHHPDGEHLDIGGDAPDRCKCGARLKWHYLSQAKTPLIVLEGVVAAMVAGNLEEADNIDDLLRQLRKEVFDWTR